MEKYLLEFNETSINEQTLVFPPPIFDDNQARWCAMPSITGNPCLLTWNLSKPMVIRTTSPQKRRHTGQNTVTKFRYKITDEKFPSCQISSACLWTVRYLRSWLQRRRPHKGGIDQTSPFD